MNKENEVEAFYDGASSKYKEHNDRICDRILEHFLLVPKQVSSLRLPRSGADDFTGT